MKGSWIGFAIGTALMAYGAFGLVHETGLRSASDVGAWLVAGGLLHDLVLVSLVGCIGVVLTHWCPARLRAPIQSGLFVTAVVLALAFPALRGFGRDHVPDNASVDPLNYTTAVLTVLAAVWTAVAVWLLARAVTTRRAPTPDQAAHRPPTDARPGDRQQSRR